MVYLVNGAAGFIGAAVARRLLDRGEEVIGIDNLNDYYAVQLKRNRLATLADKPSFTFAEVDIADPAGLNAALAPHKVTHCLLYTSPSPRDS